MLKAQTETPAPIDTTAKNEDKIVLSDIDLSSGKGAITSGVFLYLNLSSKNGFLSTTISNNDVEITYLFRFWKDKILIGPNAGFFFNTPFAGPQLIFTPFKFIETFHWIGWSLGKPDGVVDFKNPGFLFAVNSVSINAWRFKATYCLINYLKNPLQQTVTLKYSHPVNKKFDIYVDGGWDFLNKTQLLKLGVKIKMI